MIPRPIRGIFVLFNQKNMNELSLVLQKEQEIKERIEAAQKEADLAVKEKKMFWEKELEKVAQDEQEIVELEAAKNKKIKAIEEKYQKEESEIGSEKNREMKREKLEKAAEHLKEMVLCLK